MIRELSKRGTSIRTFVDAIMSRAKPMVLLGIVAVVMLVPGLATLPPMDRDEPRFAQASKQMLETSDFVDIRFGNEARNKKPVGIHWLQAASVWLADSADVQDAARQIWIYRIPSLLGAIATVLLTYWAALPFVTRRGAVLAGMLMAATPLLGAEARLATTDAVLAATVTAAMGAIMRLYLAETTSSRGRMSVPAVFWISIGVGILIKGPITPMIPAFFAIVVSVKDRSWRWLTRLRALPGVILCLVIVLPWFVLILLRTHGAFFADAVGHDLLGKVANGQESHGAPPGFYTLAFWVTAWPLAPFVALGVPTLWRHRGDRHVVMLLGWIVPMGLLLEAISTKLVHYALPLYPALAILAVVTMERAAADRRPYRATSGWVLFGLVSLVPLAVAGLVVAGQGKLWELGVVGVGLAGVALAIPLVLAWQARRFLLAQRPRLAGAVAVLAAAPLYVFVYGWLLSPGIAGSLSVSPRLVREAEAALDGTCAEPLYATVGDREPSLMFATNAALLMTDAEGAARFMADGPCRVAFVDRRDDPAFKAALDPGLGVEEASPIAGIAINGGHKLDIGVYFRRQP